MSKWKDASTATVYNAQRIAGLEPRYLLRRTDTRLTNENQATKPNTIAFTFANADGNDFPCGGTVVSFDCLASNDVYIGAGFQLLAGLYNRGLFFRQRASSGNGGDGAWKRIVLQDL